MVRALGVNLIARVRINCSFIIITSTVLKTILFMLWPSRLLDVSDRSMRCYWGTADHQLEYTTRRALLRPAESPP